MIPALQNHLLQSTIFAAVAALLTLFLRNNHARTRYWLWFAASMKFLIPFSLFVDIGRRLSWAAPPVIAQPPVYLVMNEITQPFAMSSAPAAAAVAPSIVPTLLLVFWVVGSAAILITWFAGWLRMAGSLRKSTLLTEGREFESLQRLGGRTKLLSSTTKIEPGVFGILRPVLSLPAGIADNLDDAQLDAIIAHELTHIRRRDNLTSVLHMLVEAAFWLHPLVWWIGAKLVEERERACDEEVVRLGGDPEIYAETILQVCKLYLATPLPCVAGISGSSLGRRIESIMANPVLRRLSFGRKLLLGTAALLALLTPLAIGIVTAPATAMGAIASDADNARLRFETISMTPAPVGPMHRSGGPNTADPERIAWKSIALGTLVNMAYGVTEDKVSAPGWIYLENYDLSVKTPADTTPEQFWVMLQNLLSDRFHLAAHRATRESPGYELVVAKSGPKLKDSELAPNAALRHMRQPDALRNPQVDRDGFPELGDLKGMSVMAGPNGRSMEKCQNCSVFMLVRQLENLAGTWTPGGAYPPELNPALIVDKTGLTGEYDFTFAYSDDAIGHPDIFGQIEQQLGLELRRVDRIPVDFLVVDHVDKDPAQKEIGK